MTLEELKDGKVPVVQIDKSLDQYDGVVLFPEKLAKANEMLRRVPFPKDIKDLKKRPGSEA